MTATTALLGLFGAGIGLGVTLIVAGWRGAAAPRWPRWIRRAVDRWGHGWALAAGGVGVVVAVVTGWLVGGVLAAMATVGLPRLFMWKAAHARVVARIEAVASWSEMLRDTLSAAAGLEQAIIATGSTAPEAIESEIQDLVLRLERGDRLASSLRHLADQLADPTGDLVISALVLASEKQARQLAELLGELAAETRDQVSMRLRVEAGRARTRTGMRLIVGATLVFAGGLLVLNRSYLVAFDSASGQFVLAMVGGLFVVALCWLRRMADYQVPARFLTDLDALHPGDREGVRA